MADRTFLRFCNTCSDTRMHRGVLYKQSCESHMEGPSSKRTATSCIEGGARNCSLSAWLRCLPTPTLRRPFSLPASFLDIAHSRNCLGPPPWCWAECWERVVQQCTCFLGYHNKLLATGCLQTQEIHFLRSGGQESETSKAAFPPEALGENPSLLLPASRGSKCFLWSVTQSHGILVSWPGIKSVPPAVEARGSNDGTTREFPLPPSSTWPSLLRSPISLCLSPIRSLITGFKSYPDTPRRSHLQILNYICKDPFS